MGPAGRGFEMAHRHPLGGHICTLYSGAIGGLLALRDGHFSILPWIIVTLGLFLAHGANNILNDYTDYKRGVDEPPYFRTQYSVQPITQRFWTTRQAWLVCRLRRAGFPRRTPSGTPAFRPRS